MDLDNSFFERLANKITAFTGSAKGLLCALTIVSAWSLTGPIFDFSSNWQLVINTTTTIITFLMVFVIQKSQNKDSKAIQLKLNELIATNEHASNRMVDIEDLTEAELDKLHEFYVRLSNLVSDEDDIHRSHSIDAIEEILLSKKRIKSPKKPNKESNKK